MDSPIGVTPRPNGLSFARCCSYRVAGASSSVHMLACPHCGIALVKKVPRRGLREYILSLLTIGPFRCQVCTHRFLAFKWWPSTNPSREYDRVPARYPVLLSAIPKQFKKQREEGTLLDISMRGCAVKSNGLCHKGQHFCVRIQLPDQEPPIEIDDVIVRTLTGQRIGLEFLRIRHEEETRLRELLLTLMHGS